LSSVKYVEIEKERETLVKNIISYFSIRNQNNREKNIPILSNYIFPDKITKGEVVLFNAKNHTDAFLFVQRIIKDVNNDQVSFFVLLVTIDKIEQFFIALPDCLLFTFNNNISPHLLIKKHLLYFKPNHKKSSNSFLDKLQPVSVVIPTVKLGEDFRYEYSFFDSLIICKEAETITLPFKVDFELTPDKAGEVYFLFFQTLFHMKNAFRNAENIFLEIISSELKSDFVYKFIDLTYSKISLNENILKTLNVNIKICNFDKQKFIITNYYDKFLTLPNKMKKIYFQTLMYAKSRENSCIFKLHKKILTHIIKFINHKDFRISFLEKNIKL
jgi:hypothetical protein